MLAAPLSSVSPQEEKQGLQKVNGLTDVVLDFESQCEVICSVNYQALIKRVGFASPPDTHTHKSITRKHIFLISVHYCLKLG